MIKMLSQRNLLILLAVLAGTKFVVLPLISWQSQKLLELNAKSLQVNKASALMENKASLSQARDVVKTDVKELQKRFFKNSPNIKVSIQQEIEDMFALNKVELSQFNWLTDFNESGEIRVLSAKLRFSGGTGNMIQTFWEFSRRPELIEFIETRYDFRTNYTRLGTVSGYAIVKFRVLLQSFDGRPYPLLLVDDGSALQQPNYEE